MAGLTEPSAHECDSTKTLELCAAKKQIWNFLRDNKIAKPKSSWEDIVVLDCGIYNIKNVLTSDISDNLEQGINKLQKILESPQFAEIFIKHTIGVQKAPNNTTILEYDSETKRIIQKDAPSLTDQITAQLKTPSSKFLAGQAAYAPHQNGIFLANTGSSPSTHQPHLAKLLATLEPQHIPSFKAPPLSIVEPGDNKMPKFSAVLTNFNTQAIIDYAISKYTLYLVEQLSYATAFNDVDEKIQREIVTKILQIGGSYIIPTSDNVAALGPNMARLIDFTKLVCPNIERTKEHFKPNLSASQDPDILNLKKKSMRRGRGRGVRTITQETQIKEIGSAATTHIVQTNITAAHKQFLSQLTATCEGLYPPVFSVTQAQFETAQCALEYGQALIEKSLKPTIGVWAVPLGQFCDITNEGIKMPTDADRKSIEERIFVRDFDSDIFTLIKMYRNMVPNHNMSITFELMLSHITAISRHIISDSKFSVVKASKKYGLLKSKICEDIIINTIKMLYNIFESNAHFNSMFKMLANEFNIDLAQSTLPLNKAAEFESILKQIENPHIINLFYKELYDLHTHAKICFNERHCSPTINHLKEQNIMPIKMLHDYNRNLAILAKDMSNAHMLNYMISCMFPDVCNKERLTVISHMIRTLLSEERAQDFIALCFEFATQYRNKGDEELQKLWVNLYDRCNTAAQDLRKQHFKSVQTGDSNSANIAANIKHDTIINAGALQLYRFLAFGAYNTTLVLNNYWLDGAYHELIGTSEIAYHMCRKITKDITDKQLFTASKDVVTDVIRSILVNAAQAFQKTNPQVIACGNEHAKLSHPFYEYIYAIISDVLLSGTEAIERALIGLDLYTENTFKIADTDCLLTILIVLGLLEGKHRKEFINELLDVARSAQSNIDLSHSEVYNNKASLFIETHLNNLRHKYKDEKITIPVANAVDHGLKMAKERLDVLH